MAYAKKLAREEGLEEGRAEGRAEGERSATIKNAIAMKKKGFSTELISEILGMTPDEIEVLPVE